MRHVPNFITALNLVSGFIAIVFILKGNFAAACWLISAAMFFDFFDGLASRILNAYSEMGKELDSIADMVSFGVAPGLIIYQLLTGGISPQGIAESSNETMKIIFILVSTLYTVCTGLRLAKFNIDATQQTSFRGLPAPAAALSVISVVLAYLYSEDSFVRNFAESNIAVIIYAVIISILMVSRLPMLSMKIRNLRLKDNSARYLLVALCIFCIAVFGTKGIILIIPAYILISLVSAFI
ncbi:MAG: CDP-alcohol phosphatidyltransferase family protein [Bacteroidales bacterium]